MKPEFRNAALRLLVAWTACAVVATTNAWADPSSFVPPAVKVPCTTEAASEGFLRKCSEVIQGQPGISGYTGPSGIVIQLTSQMKKQIADPAHSLYRGEIVDPSSPNAFAPDTSNFGTPTCDLMPGPYNGGKPELDTNHRGESCGHPAVFEVRVSTGGVKTLMYMSGAAGTMEAAYLRGIWVQALTCHAEQVKREIELRKELNVSSSCRSMAGAFHKLGVGAEASVNKLHSSLHHQSNIADIWKCDALAGDSEELNPDVGRHRQSAQQLCAARKSMETLFTQIAMCEVFARAGKAYRGAVKEPAGFLQEIKDTVADTCKKRCTNKCGDCSSPGGCSKCGTECANDCYKPELRHFIVEKMKPWPSDGSCRL